MEYPTPPEHVHANHIEQAWAQANQRVAARLDLDDRSPAGPEEG